MTSVTEITDTDLLNLNSSPIQLVPAPGIGKIIVPIAAIMYWKNFVGGYSNISSTSILYIQTDGGETRLDFLQENAGSQVTNLLQNGNAGTQLGIASRSQTSGNSTTGFGNMNIIGSLNTPLLLNLINSLGALTDGDAANVLYIKTVYQIL